MPAPIPTTTGLPPSMHPPSAMPLPSAMLPPSTMDQSQQQCWYAWQPDPQYVPLSPSRTPMYKFPETRHKTSSKSV
ncbi:hypothetical protein FRC19_004038 [Serendipita sp. 401]|nr:hypothetical protein FRC19_004038 [Serendipita sp. 401]KAG9044587.1 hypothetical protein FS842_001448 [Serendipita sp. 407]